MNHRNPQRKSRYLTIRPLVTKQPTEKTFSALVLVDQKKPKGNLCFACQTRISYSGITSTETNQGKWGLKTLRAAAQKNRDNPIQINNDKVIPSLIYL